MVLVPEYILILFLLILIDYSAGIFIEKAEGPKRKTYLIISIIANIGLLVFFKYFNFLNENINSLLGLMHKENPIKNINIILPLGLSFHTFQSMSYTIEVYRGNQRAERHLGYFSVYVLFFPQMVAGPIERYATLGRQLRERHFLLYKNLSKGFKLMIYGFFIKMVIADNIAPIVNIIYKDPGHYNSVSVIIGIVFFSFQIYADFYGYSLIALGSASLLGIQLIDNFKTPYLAKNIHDFWQRWHISLSTWFRNYLYIPLGGNRVLFGRWIINILIVFILSGFWHGANWTFIIWGGLHGLMYLIERLANDKLNIKTDNHSLIVNLLRTVKTFIAVTIIWVFFRSESIAKAKAIFSSIIHNSNTKDDFHIDPKIWGLLGIFVLSDFLLFNKRVDEVLGKTNFVLRWSLYAILLFFIMSMSGVENLPFIYFQF
jgi:D-alanyl-lipoteichoic acid acyltransferase DltB (MBOAT superfamily)